MHRCCTVLLKLNTFVADIHVTAVVVFGALVWKHAVHSGSQSYALVSLTPLERLSLVFVLSATVWCSSLDRTCAYLASSSLTRQDMSPSATLVSDWKRNPLCSIHDNLKRQKPTSVSQFDELYKQVVGQFAEQVSQCMFVVAEVWSVWCRSG